MEDRSTSTESIRYGYIAGFLAYFVWGLMPLYVRTLAAASPFEILAHRIVWGLLLIVAALFFRGTLGHLFSTAASLFRDQKRIGGLVLLAALFAAVNWFINIIGVTTGHVIELGIGMFLTPLVTVAFGFVFYRERLALSETLSVILAAAGVLIMIWNFGRIPWVALGVSFTWGIYSAVKKKVTIPPWESIASEHTLLLIPAIAYLLTLAASGSGHFSSGDAALSARLIGMGLITTVPMILFSYAAVRLPLIVLGFIQYLNPVLTISMGVLFLGETITSEEILPLLFILSGIALYLASGVLKAKKRRASVH